MEGGTWMKEWRGKWALVEGRAMPLKDQSLAPIATIALSPRARHPHDPSPKQPLCSLSSMRGAAALHVPDHSTTELAKPTACAIAAADEGDVLSNLRELTYTPSSLRWTAEKEALRTANRPCLTTLLTQQIIWLASRLDACPEHL